MNALCTIVAALALLGGAWPAAAAPEPEGEEYRLGPDDIIQVQVWQRADLSGRFALDSNGRLTAPLVGEVPAAGLTPVELGRELTRRYAILDPGVSEVLVTVVEFHSRYLTVVGEVRNPGRYSFRDMPGLWDAILRAGGATAAGDLSAVEVVRRDPAEGEEKSIRVDLSRGLEGTPEASLPRLRPGDSIIVPAVGINAVSGDQVQVLGAVRTPGLYALRTAGTVVEAIGVSGGALDQADLGRVRLARRGPDGAVVYELDVRGYLYEGYPEADLPLQAGDTVTIPSGRSGSGRILQSALVITPLITSVVSLWLLARSLD